MPGAERLGGETCSYLHYDVGEVKSFADARRWPGLPT